MEGQTVTKSSESVTRACKLFTCEHPHTLSYAHIFDVKPLFMFDHLFAILGVGFCAKSVKICRGCGTHFTRLRWHITVHVTTKQLCGEIISKIMLCWVDPLDDWAQAGIQHSTFTRRCHKQVYPVQKKPNASSEQASRN